MKLLRLPILALCAALTAASAFAIPIRTITTVTMENWRVVDSGDRAHTEWLLDQVGLFTLDQSFSLLAKARYGTDESSSPYTGMGAGLSYIIARSVYADIMYSALARTDSWKYTSEIESSVNYENDRLYAGLRERIQVNDAALVLYSTISAKYAFIEPLALWSSYTLTYDRDLGLDQAYWGYVEVSPTPVWSVTLGGSASSFHYEGEYAPKAQGTYYSLIAGLAARPSRTMRFKYQFEYFLGDKDSNKTGHTVIADIRF